MRVLVDYSSWVSLNSERRRLVDRCAHLEATLASLTEPIHMSNSVYPDCTVCGVRFAPSVKRTPKRSEVTCETCLSLDNASREAAKTPTPWGGY